jgi:hypothetical protein
MGYIHAPFLVWFFIRDHLGASYDWQSYIYTRHTASDCIPSASAPNASIRTLIILKSYRLDLITLESCAAQ